MGGLLWILRWSHILLFCHSIQLWRGRDVMRPWAWVCHNYVYCTLQESRAIFPFPSHLVWTRFCYYATVLDCHNIDYFTACMCYKPFCLYRAWHSIIYQNLMRAYVWVPVREPWGTPKVITLIFFFLLNLNTAGLHGIIDGLRVLLLYSTWQLGIRIRANIQYLLNMSTELIWMYCCAAQIKMRNHRLIHWYMSYTVLIHTKHCIWSLNLRFKVEESKFNLKQGKFWVILQRQRTAQIAHHWVKSASVFQQSSDVGFPRKTS